ncbi:hypothetical protein BDR03DRAFT_948122 [Suillus americanus]|nr:hypothetical protein BDR03DRAFT_948122 [Suillus americanus]
MQLIFPLCPLCLHVGCQCLLSPSLYVRLRYSSYLLFFTIVFFWNSLLAIQLPL